MEKEIRPDVQNLIPQPSAKSPDTLSKTITFQLENGLVVSITGDLNWLSFSPLDEMTDTGYTYRELNKILKEDP